MALLRDMKYLQLSRARVSSAPAVYIEYKKHQRYNYKTDSRFEFVYKIIPRPTALTTQPYELVLRLAWNDLIVVFGETLQFVCKTVSKQKCGKQSNKFTFTEKLFTIFFESIAIAFVSRRAIV